jgi:hypothetical protein
VDALGHSSPQGSAPIRCTGVKARHPLDKLNRNRPFREPTVY